MNSTHSDGTPPYNAHKGIRGNYRKGEQPPTADLRLVVAAGRVATFVVILGVWQLCADISVIPSNILGEPSSVARALVSGLSHGKLLIASWQTLETLVIGLAIAAPIGVFIGLATRIPAVDWLFGPLMTIGYAVPKVSLVTLYILLFGIGANSHILVVIGGPIFVYYFGARSAAAGIDPDQIFSLRLLGANRYAVIRLLVIRSMIPQIFAATRIAVPLSLTLAIFSELWIPASSGLGGVVASYEQALDGPSLMMVFLFIVFVAYLIDVALSRGLQVYLRSVGLGSLT